MIVLCAEHGSVERDERNMDPLKWNMDMVTRNGSIKMEHSSDKQNMDLVVPFEMEHRSQILKYGLSVVRLLGPAVVRSCQRVPHGRSFLNWPTCSSRVQSLMFPIATFLAFGV